MTIDDKVLLNLAEKSFAVWAASPTGTEKIAELSKSIPTMESMLALGADHAAKKKLWKNAEAVSKDTALGILLAGHADAFSTYPGIVGGLLSPHSVMPDTGGSFLPDVYALPHYLVKEYALKKFTEQQTAGPMEKVGEVIDLTTFVVGWVDHFDQQYTDRLRLRKEPSYLAKESVPAVPNWLVLGFEADYEWKPGAARGHFFLSHDTLKSGQKPNSKERKEAEANVVKLETELAAYDLNRRAEIIAMIERCLQN